MYIAVTSKLFPTFHRYFKLKQDDGKRVLLFSSISNSLSLFDIMNAIKKCRNILYIDIYYKFSEWMHTVGVYAAWIQFRTRWWISKFS